MLDLCGDPASKTQRGTWLIFIKIFQAMENISTLVFKSVFNLALLNANVDFGF